MSKIILGSSVPLNGGEKGDSSMRGTKNQEGVVFKMVRDLSIIFGRKKRASQWRWLMCHGRDEITDEEVLGIFRWHF